MLRIHHTLMFGVALLGLPACANLNQANYINRVESNPAGACAKISVKSAATAELASQSLAAANFYWVGGTVDHVTYEPDLATATSYGELHCPVIAVLTNGQQVHGLVVVNFNWNAGSTNVNWQTDVGASEPPADQQKDAQDAARQDLANQYFMSESNRCEATLQAAIDGQYQQNELARAYPGQYVPAPSVGDDQSEFNNCLEHARQERQAIIDGALVPTQ